MSELKTNPLGRKPGKSSEEHLLDKTVNLNLDAGTRSAIVKAAAILAASATKPEKRDITEVIEDFKLAVAEVESHFDSSDGRGSGNQRMPEGPVK
jgi:hypothetical protein